jgi:hypothetical protein
VLMPSDLSPMLRGSIRPEDFADEIFIEQAKRYVKENLAIRGFTLDARL